MGLSRFGLVWRLLAVLAGGGGMNWYLLPLGGRDTFMKCLVLWTGVSGYSSDCWKALAKHVDLRVASIDPGLQSTTAFQESLVSGLNVRRFSDPWRERTSLSRWAVTEFAPDLVLVAGWHVRAYRALVPRLSAMGARLVLCMDNVYEGTVRQKAAPVLLGRYLRHFHFVFVPGERSAAYARHLGFEQSQVIYGLYAFNQGPFLRVAKEREGAPWPQRFLYVGQLIERKGVSDLLAAYRRYRVSSGDPWPLVVAGKGPLEVEVAGEGGVEYLGFVQPCDLPQLMMKCGCFLFPSRNEHWGVAPVEAGASGMPLLLSQSVGALPEILLHRYNGLEFRAGDVLSLAAAMSDIAADISALPLWGGRSVELASRFEASQWSERLLDKVGYRSGF